MKIIDKIQQPTSAKWTDMLSRAKYEEAMRASAGRGLSELSNQIGQPTTPRRQTPVQKAAGVARRLVRSTDLPRRALAARRFLKGAWDVVRSSPDPLDVIGPMMQDMTRGSYPRPRWQQGRSEDETL